MINPYIKISVYLVIPLLLSGCESMFGEHQGFFRDRMNEYQYVEEPQTLVVPDELSVDTIQPLHPIPDDPRSVKSVDTSVEPMPAPALEMTQAVSSPIEQPLSGVTINHTVFRVWLMSELALNDSGYKITKRDELNKVYEVVNENDEQESVYKVFFHPLDEGKKTTLEVLDMQGEQIASEDAQKVMDVIANYMKNTS